MILAPATRLILLLMALLAPVVARAGDEIVHVSEVIDVEVLPGWREADGRHVAGLRFRVAPGWKTYWRTAGSTGITPRMDWRRSRNVVAVDPRWPTPVVSGPDSARSIGYVSDFVLPLVIRTADAARPVRLRGRLDIGICRDVCLPARLSVAADLAPGGTMDPAIAAALQDQPTRLDILATCSMRPTESGAMLTSDIPLPPMGGSEFVVFELPDPGLWVTDAAVRRDGGILRARSELMAGGGRPISVDRGRIRITVIGDGRAVEILGCTG